MSDYIDDQQLNLSKFILNMGAYNRRIKSQILFNHLSASRLTQMHFVSILKGKWLKTIIDHENYNPRIIAAISSECVDIVEPADFPRSICKHLENPDLIWSKPFRTLLISCQNLLICLYFGHSHGETIQDLRSVYTAVHRNICNFHSQSTRPSDFEDSLRILESGFVSISDTTVDFINPSLRDFLSTYLVNIDFLKLLPGSVRRADWCERLWSHVRHLFAAHPETLSSFAQLFRGLVEFIGETPSIKSSTRDGRVFSYGHDLSLLERVELLLQWWEWTRDDIFVCKSAELLREDSVDLVIWRDGPRLPEFHRNVNHMAELSSAHRRNLIDGTELRLIEVLESGIEIDDLFSVVEGIYDHMDGTISDQLGDVVESTLDDQFEDPTNSLGHLDSREDLLEHLEYIERLSEITHRDASTIKDAVKLRINECQTDESSERVPQFGHRANGDREDFDDNALRSLFSNLIYR